MEGLIFGILRYPQKRNDFIEMNATFDIRIKVCIKASKKRNFIGKLTKFKNDHHVFTSWCFIRYSRIVVNEF